MPSRNVGQVHSSIDSKEPDLIYQELAEFITKIHENYPIYRGKKGLLLVNPHTIRLIRLVKPNYNKTSYDMIESKIESDTGLNLKVIYLNEVLSKYQFKVVYHKD